MGVARFKSAMVSTPSYDPNPLSSHEPSGIQARYKQLAAADNDPLLNRAINQRYPPGSTFKVVVAAAVANRGVLMKPYLVDEVQAPDFRELDRTEPEELSTAVSPDVADGLTRMMRGVVAGGTGRAAQIAGIDVAGKTGTAEDGTDRPPHAWFIGFAEKDGRKVAVSVIIENGGNSGSETTGGRAAAPVARNVMAAVLNAGGG